MLRIVLPSLCWYKLQTIGTDTRRVDILCAHILKNNDLFLLSLASLQKPFLKYFLQLKGTVSRAGLVLYLSFSSGIDILYNFHSPPANGKQGPIPEEMSQTLLTNMKQGNLD
jgi:hypothetical protein